MSDLISRADAIDRIANDNVVGGMKTINEFRESNRNNDFLDGISSAMATVEDVPSVSADRSTDWTPLRFEDEYKMTSDFPWELDGSWVIVTDGQRVSVERIKKDAYDHFFPNGRYFELEDTIAWMPLPKIINNITESPNDVDETDDEVIEPSDIISRADAKKEVYLLGKNPSINEIWDCLDALPSADAEPKWNCTANFVAEQLDRLRNMTDEERWEFFKRFFEMKGGDTE